MKKLSTGSQIVAENGKTYFIEGLISSGTGQGDVYRVNSEGSVYAMKLFHSGDPKKQLRQIKLLISRGKICESYVYPIDMVRYQGMVGYTMEYVGGDYLDSSVLYNGILKRNKQTELPYHQKLGLLHKITQALKILNDANLSLLDVKFDNIKVRLSDNSIRILDTDTIIYNKDTAMINGTVGFMPPATMKGEPPDKYNDCYAVAVMIFMTLMGSHPLVGKLFEEPCNVNTEQYAFAINPIYIFDRNSTKNRPVPADKNGVHQQRTIDRMKKYPSYFGDAMQKTFGAGLHNGEKRTTLDEWLTVLEKLYEDSYVCSTCGEELFFNSFKKNCDVCLSEIKKPIRLSSGQRSLPLFNGMKILSSELFVDGADYPLFLVTVSDYDKKYGLKCLSDDEYILNLEGGIAKKFRKDEIIPIFLDGTVTVNNRKLKFLI